MILETLVGAVIPLASNLVKSAFDSKDKKTQASVDISNNAVELAKVQADIQKSDNEFEIERLKAVEQITTSSSGFMRNLNDGIRVGIGGCALILILTSVIGYFIGKQGLLKADTLESVVGFTLSYYFAEKSCRKTWGA
ncbi:MAG: hypothetical protein LBV16_02480 [Elusimicrobiota bacterium]|jgi:hypothetical protein|nr:hypothetical protein [Elusimicrobiota bacterium]